MFWIQDKLHKDKEEEHVEYWISDAQYLWKADYLEAVRKLRSDTLLRIAYIPFALELLKGAISTWLYMINCPAKYESLEGLKRDAIFFTVKNPWTKDVLHDSYDCALCTLVRMLKSPPYSCARCPLGSLYIDLCDQGHMGCVMWQKAVTAYEKGQPWKKYAKKILRSIVKMEEKVEMTVAEWNQAYGCMKAELLKWAPQYFIDAVYDADAESLVLTLFPAKGGKKEEQKRLKSPVAVEALNPHILMEKFHELLTIAGVKYE